MSESNKDESERRYMFLLGCSLIAPPTLQYPLQSAVPAYFFLMRENGTARVVKVLCNAMVATRDELLAWYTSKIDAALATSQSGPIDNSVELARYLKEQGKDHLIEIVNIADAPEPIRTAAEKLLKTEFYVDSLGRLCLHKGASVEPEPIRGRIEDYELPPFHKAEDFYQRALMTNAVARQIYELAQHHQIEEIPMLRYMVGCLAKLCGTYAELAVEASLRNPEPVSMSTPPNKLKTQHDASDPERDGM